MAIKKSQIYSSLWSSCDALRGGMDASQYKDYILTLLFLKYISDRSESDPEAQIEVPEGCRFADLLTLRGDKEIGEKIDIAIQKIADVNELGGVINNASFNNSEKLGDGKDMVDRLTKLLSIFARPELDFRKNRAEGDDILGDAYEYLMRHFATESGKSKGQFYTPSEVSRIMAEVVGINKETKQDDTIYDPTCGSGSLLLKAADAAPNGMSIYGQEKDVATFALARMNMVIHNNADAEMARANTITQPKFKNANGGLKTFDYVVANPPFSDKAWSTGLEQEYGRFEYGMPPAKNGDYAYLLHVLASMKSAGKAVVVMPHGVLFRGNAEAEIRKKIIQHGFIKGIIGLPANLFYGTGIPACLIVLDKENANARTGVFMIDASKGLVKDGNKNRLRHQDVHKIVDVFLNQREIDGYSRMVPVSEIRSEQNDCNLNIPRYIDGSENEDLQDIEAHLKGGIPKRDIDALSPFWKAMPSLRSALFSVHEREGYLNANHAPEEVRAVIMEHPDFMALSAKLDAIFAGWRDANRPKMAAFDEGSHPKDLIHEVSEDLLASYSNAPLIDRYAAYQHIMAYWSEVMQDDCYLIAEDGWNAGRQIRELVKNSDGKFSEEPDLTIGSGKKAVKLKAEIIPPPLIVDRFFPEEKEKLELLEAALEAVEQKIVELDEEHSGEDGLFAECRDGRGKITAGPLKERRKELVEECEKGIFKSYDNKSKSGADSDALKQEFLEAIPDFLELMAIDDMIRLNAEKTKTAKIAKAAKAELDKLTVAKYLKLSDSEVMGLVIDDKWLAAIKTKMTDERDEIAQKLTSRIKILIERYESTLGRLIQEDFALAAKVLEAAEEAQSENASLSPSRSNWRQITLSECATFRKGSGLPKSDLSESGKYECIHYGELFTEYGARIDNVLSKTDRQDSAVLSKENDVLMPTSDVTPNGLAKASCISKSGVILGGDTLVICPNPKILRGTYLAYLIRADKGQIMSLVSGTTVFHIYPKDMAQFSFHLPSLDEQDKIIAYLEDAASEIDMLERRITKVSNVSFGLSQALLFAGRSDK